MKNALSLTRQLVGLAGFASIAVIGAVGAVKNGSALLTNVATLATKAK